MCSFQLTVIFLLAALAPELGRSSIITVDYLAYCKNYKDLNRTSDYNCCFDYNVTPYYLVLNTSIAGPMYLHCMRGMVSEENYKKMYSKELNLTYLCDTGTDKGGWIVLLRRVHKNTTFNQQWEQYKRGFGNTCTDHWLGLEYIHQLTRTARYELRIEFTVQNHEYYVQYDNFSVGDEASGYTLHVSGYSGNASDEFSIDNNNKFITSDRDNDRNSGNIAVSVQAPWWYGLRVHAVFTGQFDRAVGVNWPSITKYSFSLQAVEMKMREKSNLFNKHKK